MLEGIALGFLLGILFESGRGYLREKDLLDRISWRSPSDYWFMTQQRKEQLKAKKFDLGGIFKPLKKKQAEPKLDPQDPQVVARSLEKEIEAQQVESGQYHKFVKQKEEASKQGVFI